ncbi:hypothetical protein SUDANB132_01531 [Streptomyces sp. enrichment culture]
MVVITSRIISYGTADRADVVALLGAAGNLTSGCPGGGARGGPGQRTVKAGEVPVNGVIVPVRLRASPW